MKLISIPNDVYENYKLDVIFDAYKWDPQYFDNNTIARHILVISEKEHAELKLLTEKLDNETVRAENFLYKNINHAKPLKIPHKIINELNKSKNYSSYNSINHIRLTRYDFHPTTDNNWAISEVNSDVPGGFAEGSLLPQVALKHIKNNNYRFDDFGGILSTAIKNKTKPGGKVALVHCTTYSDDRQVMQFLGDKLETSNFTVIYAAADHIRFENNKAKSILDENTGEIDAIVRFTPLEWLVKMKPKHWGGYFNTTTVSCNHPIAIFAQTKRFPFVWDLLEEHGVDMPTWRELLPETFDVRIFSKLINKEEINKDEYIYKPVYGRVGEKISIKEACNDEEYEKILSDVKRKPENFIAQKRFNSKPLISSEGESYHTCLGSFCVDGKQAGYYARISKTPRIDSGAADIPVLIEREA